MVMRQQPLYTPAVRSSREHPPDERQLSASPRASPFPSQEILQSRMSTWLQPEAASASCSLLPAVDPSSCCAMRPETASLLPCAAVLCITRGHGPAPSRKRGPRKKVKFYPPTAPKRV